MIYSYDLAVLKRETRKLEEVVGVMKRQAITLQQYGQTDLAANAMKQIELLDALIAAIMSQSSTSKSDG
ncbi:hypothetical protein [Pseudomonas jessenii]|uniref:hypothetical protein n=1 Tax=Pseudomonas jessenii TaxID=77298 RepID=UPI0038926DD2